MTEDRNQKDRLATVFPKFDLFLINVTMRSCTLHRVPYFRSSRILPFALCKVACARPPAFQTLWPAFMAARSAPACVRCLEMVRPLLSTFHPLLVGTEWKTFLGIVFSFLGANHWVFNLQKYNVLRCPYVRVAPNNGRMRCAQPCPLCANSGHVRSLWGLKSVGPHRCPNSGRRDEPDQGFGGLFLRTARHYTNTEQCVVLDC